MNIIDKIFSKFSKEKAPENLRAAILAKAKQDSATPLAQKAEPKLPFFFFSFSMLKPALALLLVVAIGSGLFYRYFAVPNLAAAFELSAEVGDTFGIPTNGTFILKSSKTITAYQVMQVVKFEPEVPFDVESLGNNTFRIKPAVLLGDQVYQITIPSGLADRDYSWAYQVKAKYLVVSTNPGNKGTLVPTNTGIEVTLNRENPTQVENFFEITPKVQGRFEVHGDTFVFIPNKPLEETKIYTVKVRQGMPLQNSSDTLSKDYTFSFETASSQGSNYGFFDFQRDFEQTLPNKKPTLGIFSYNFDMAKDIQNTDVFTFASAEDFTASYTNSREWDFGWSTYYRTTGVKVDTSKASKIATFKPNIQTVNSQIFFEFPEQLASGHYLAVTHTTNGDKYVWLQVSPLAQYFSVTHDKGIMWVKDFTTKQNVQGAKVSVNVAGKVTELATTDKSGLATFSTPEQLKQEVGNTSPVFFKIISGGNSLIAKAQDIWGITGANRGDQYWKFLGTDRNLYQMTDDIHFWGVAKGRTQDLREKKLSVGLYTGYFYAGDSLPEDAQALYSQEVTVSSFDTFEGSLHFKGLQPTTYSLIVTNGRDVVTSTTVEVQTYTKPAYQLTVTASSDYAYAGDPITFTVKGSFFDGTPIGNLKLKYNGYWNNAIEGQVTLDASGTGKVTITPEYTNGQYVYYPRSLNIQFSPLLAEEGEISAQASVYVFGPHMLMSAYQDKQSGNHYDFKVKLNNIDFSKGDINQQYGYFYDYMGSPVVNFGLHATITKVYYEQVETGNMYDPISKTVYPTYRFDEHRDVVDNFTGMTNQSGEWNISKDLPEVKNGYYLVRLDGKDTFGRDLVSEFTAYKWGDYTGFASYNQDQQFGIELKIPNVPDNEQVSRMYSVGDTVNLVVSGAPGKIQGDVLYYSYQNNIMDAKVTPSTSYTTTFTKEMVPNVQYKAVVLGPSGFVQSGNVYVNFKSSDRELTIDMVPEKQNYRPGEHVKLSIQVKDKDKKGVAAQVNISAVDEAIFHIPSYTYQSSVLDSIYSMIYVQPIVGYTQFLVLPNGGGGAERGGGGGGGVRTNFKDMAKIATITTSSSGNGVFEFDLPDNITSWRATARAYNASDMLAGENKVLISSGLPFFVDATMNKVYLKGDQPLLKVRAFGTAMQQNQPVEFKITSDALKLNATQTSSTGSVDFPLGSLPQGTYSIRIDAKQGNNSDAVVRTITVVGNFFKKAESTTVSLTPGLTNLKGNPEGTTDVVFSDQGLGKYYGDLKNLSYGYGVRSDSLAASYFAGQQLAKYFGEQAPDGVSLSAYDHTGIGLLTYSDVDLELSAKLADLVPDNLNKTTLAQYFEASLKEEKTDIHRVALALYGESGIGKPALARLQNLMLSPELNMADKVYVALGLAKFGDKENARKVYTNDIQPKLTLNGNELSASFESDSTKQVKITASVAELAGMLGYTDDAQKLFAFTQTHYPVRDLAVVEQSLALRELLPRANKAEARFTYILNGKSTSVTLKNGQVQRLTLTSDQLANLKITKASGDVGVTTYYDAFLDPNAIQKTNKISLERKYTVNGKATTQFSDGDIVKVTLIPRINGDALDGEYQITDFLPAGLKAITDVYSVDASPYQYCNGYTWPQRVENNTLSFSFYRNQGGYVDPNCIEPTLNYYARVISKGDFTAHPAIIQSTKDLDYLNVSNPATVKIK